MCCTVQIFNGGNLFATFTIEHFQIVQTLSLYFIQIPLGYDSIDFIY